MYSILTVLLYSHTFCWQNQNQFNLEFSIVINMWARTRAKYEIVLNKLLLNK